MPASDPSKQKEVEQIILEELEKQVTMSREQIYKSIVDKNLLSRGPTIKVLNGLIDKGLVIERKPEGDGRKKVLFLPKNEKNVNLAFTGEIDYMRKRLMVKCREIIDRGLNQRYVDERDFQKGMKVGILPAHLEESERYKHRIEVKDDCLALYSIIEAYEKSSNLHFPRPWGDKPVSLRRESEMNGVTSSVVSYVKKGEVSNYAPFIEEFYQFFFTVEARLASKDFKA